MKEGKKNMKKKSKTNRSFVIGNSKITLTKKGIKIQSPKVIIDGDVIQTGNISASNIESTKLKTDFC